MRICESLKREKIKWLNKLFLEKITNRRNQIISLKMM